MHGDFDEAVGPGVALHMLAALRFELSETSAMAEPENDRQAIVPASIGLAEDDRLRAVELARRAAEVAAARRDRPALALAYEIRSRAEDPPDPTKGAVLARSAQARLDALGARHLAAEAAELHRRFADGLKHQLEIRTLGTFVVLRNGVDVSAARRIGEVDEAAKPVAPADRSRSL